MTSTSRLLLIGIVTSLLSCHAAPTAPTHTELQRAQAAWKARGFTRYAYRYETVGFFNAFDGRVMRLVVLSDTVRSAQFVATNDSVPTAPATLPTIDALFARAIAASVGGTLVSITFDPVLGYPTVIELSGPPDARGSLLASAIEFLP
jgi:Family of unknown function (DUF6174)